MERKNNNIKRHQELHSLEVFALTYVFMCALTKDEVTKIGVSSATSAAFYLFLAPWLIKQIDKSHTKDLNH